MGSISEEETCEKLKGLIQRQVHLCKRNLEVMDSVRRGAQLAIEECQYQFRNRRWNCSTLDSLPVFGKVVTQGERRPQGLCGWEGGAECAVGKGMVGRGGLGCTLWVPPSFYRRSNPGTGRAEGRGQSCTREQEQRCWGLVHDMSPEPGSVPLLGPPENLSWYQHCSLRLCAYWEQVRTPRSAGAWGSQQHSLKQ